MIEIILSIIGVIAFIFFLGRAIEKPSEGNIALIILIVVIIMALG